MLKYLTPGLAAAALFGSAAYLAPLAGYAQGAPAVSPQPAPAAAPAQPPAGTGQKSAQAPAPASVPDKQMASANRKAFMDARIAALRAGLELTPAQAPLWSPVESAIRDLGAQRGKWMEAKRQDGSMLPLDKLKQRGEFMVQRGQALKALADAAAPLTASFDPAQKQRLPMLLGAAFKHRGILFAAFNVPGNQHDGMRGRRGEGPQRGAMGRDEMGHGEMDHGEMRRGEGGYGYGPRMGWGEGMGRGEDGDGGHRWNHERFGEEEHGGFGGWHQHRHDGDERDPT